MSETHATTVLAVRHRDRVVLSDMGTGAFVIDRADVDRMLADIVTSDDLSRYIL